MSIALASDLYRALLARGSRRRRRCYATRLTWRAMAAPPYLWLRVKDPNTRK